MDRHSGQGSTLSGSYTHSMHSLAEGSEAISEAEEILEVQSLQKRGDKAFEKKNYTEALKHYNEALEIDETNADALGSRAAVYLEMSNFVLAQQDVERLLLLQPQHPQGHYLLGVALENLGQFRDALLSFLRAMDRDKTGEHSDILTNNIATLASHFCRISPKLYEDLPGMDAYKKLCEVGGCLYSARRYELCIKVLNAAQRIATNQKGITMRLQLTLANAHSKLKHRDIAIALYQECLVTAISAHDYQYQTKALVNIASLFLEAHETHQAIVYYEKLIDLQNEIQGENPGEPLPDYWNKDLECALNLNLSIAYKAIGAMEKAVRHAQLYVSLIKKYDNLKYAESQSHQNLGLLNEILGQYEEAIKSYKMFLKTSKERGDLNDSGTAYGCLGSVYAMLKNRQLSITYHEQHIAIARKIDDMRSLSTAYEQMGDSYMRMGEHAEAVECYTGMFQSTMRNDVRMQTTALCKIGKANKAMERYQYSLYYFEQAKVIAGDFDFTEIRLICEFNQACILQFSTQMYELDQAKSYFEKLIPLYETKIHQHQEEDTFCPQELHADLADCYEGMQMVLSKMAKKAECLIFAEGYRRKCAYNLNATLSIPMMSPGSSHVGMLGFWGIEKIIRVVSQQRATVLYYSILHDMLLLWVLRPGHGVIRFYTHTTPRCEGLLTEQIRCLVEQLYKRMQLKELQYSCENRALPLRETELELIQKRNEDLAMKNRDSLLGSESITIIDNTTIDDDASTVIAESQSAQSVGNKSPDRQLFDLLLGPVDDILSKLDDDSPLVIVPDKDLSACPFSILRDWDGTLVGERFKITCIPSLFTLEKTTSNELNQLKAQDSLEFERVQSRMGGIPKLLHTVESNKSAESPPNLLSSVTEVSFPTTTTLEYPNPKRTSNPGLMKAGLFRLLAPPKTGLMSREQTFMSAATRATSVSRKTTGSVIPAPPVTKPLKATHQIGAPTILEKMMNMHNLNTLVHKTATGTDITSSECSVPEFQQISNQYRSVVIGNPQLEENVMLHGGEWVPNRELKMCQTECYHIADILETNAVVAKEATKKRFLQEAPKATILHIASVGCMTEACIVMTPNPDRHESGPPLEASYLVTANEIAALSLTAKLVVLSLGWSTYQQDVTCEGYKLPTAFLIAGAQCVLMLLWPIPNAALNKFYFFLYGSLSQGQQVTLAVQEARTKMQKDVRYSDPFFWAPFILIGKDVEINLMEIRKAMLHQMIDKTEKEMAEDTGNNPLNPPASLPSVPTRLEMLTSLQKCMSALLIQHQREPHIITQLIDLLDGALKRLHVEENNKKASNLLDQVIANGPAMDLLKLLGFHFQSRSCELTEPYVIYPHWNPHELLVPTYDALRALADMSSNADCCCTVGQMLPLNQDLISYMVDVLCITKHAPEIQLKVGDLSVKALWYSPQIKSAMLSMGFHQIGPLLSFNSVPSFRKLLLASLQLLISLSSHKSPALLHKLDVSLLGGQASTKVSTTGVDHVKLPSLTPLMLPRNQLRMSTPWLSAAEHSEEMDEKKKLAKSKAEVATEYKKQMERALSWQQTTLSAQADETLESVGKPSSKPESVKVQSGSTPSMIRIPIEKIQELTIDETQQRRDYARYVLGQRMSNISLRHRNDVQRLYLPYVQN